MLMLLLAGDLAAKAKPKPTPEPTTVPEPQEVLFRPKGGFPAQGGPAFKAAYFPAGAATMVGGRGEVVFKDAWGVGFGSYALATELLADQPGVKRDIGFSYGGLQLNYSFFQQKLLYLNFGALMGPGQAYAVSRQEGAKREYANFFVIEPELSTMVNVTGDLRVGVGAGYRLTTESDTERIIGSRMNGWSLSFTLMYGKTTLGTKGR
jgi:hypothetical protein